MNKKPLIFMILTIFAGGVISAMLELYVKGSNMFTYMIPFMAGFIACEFNNAHLKEKKRYEAEQRGEL